MATANNPDDYKAAWQTHVIEIRAVFYAAGKTNDDWDKFYHQMQTIIDTASDNVFSPNAAVIPTDTRA